jgi:hypothetical protein
LAGTGYALLAAGRWQAYLVAFGTRVVAMNVEEKLLSDTFLPAIEKPQGLMMKLASSPATSRQCASPGRGWSMPV